MGGRGGPNFSFELSKIVDVLPHLALHPYLIFLGVPLPPRGPYHACVMAANQDFLKTPYRL